MKAAICPWSQPSTSSLVGKFILTPRNRSPSLKFTVQTQTEPPDPRLSSKINVPSWKCGCVKTKNGKSLEVSKTPASRKPKWKFHVQSKLFTIVLKNRLESKIPVLDLIVSPKSFQLQFSHNVNYINHGDTLLTSSTATRLQWKCWKLLSVFNMSVLGHEGRRNFLKT